jgi:pimeloyl-ACP methyl ester carboxylesterase
MLAGQWEVGAGAMTERVVGLPGRGNTLVWDCPGPPGAPTLVLLPGVTLTAELNWSGVMPALGAHFRVLAIGQRGHGRGLGCPVPGSLLFCCAGPTQQEINKKAVRP